MLREVGKAYDNVTREELWRVLYELEYMMDVGHPWVEEGE